ncbi:hypothetical protein [Actinoplanes sp. NPDC051851]
MTTTQYITVREPSDLAAVIAGAAMHEYDEPVDTADDDGPDEDLAWDYWD